MFSRRRSVLPACLLLMCCILFCDQAAFAQAAATPAATAASSGASSSSATAAPSAGSGSSATAAAPTPCPAAYGLFGPIGAASSSASSSSAASPTFTVTNNAAPPAAAKTAPKATSKPASAPPVPARTPAYGLSGIIDLNSPPLPKPSKLAGPPIPLNASDVAAALQGKIPGVTTLVAIGPSSILYTIDPAKTSSAPPDASTQGLAPALAIEQELITAVDALPRAAIKTDVIDLPYGFQGACAIIAMIGHQVHGIVTLSALTDTRILVGYESSPGNDQPFVDFKKLVMKLAVSTVLPAPKVQSVTMRLYYDRDAASVATSVQSAFSQLKVQSVSMNPAFTYRDAVVIADPTGMDSSNALDQARRMVAVLDEPRAQVVVNAWSLQISSDQKDAGDQLVPQARRLADGYNDALEAAVMRGWQYINRLGPGIDKSMAFDDLFTSYLCNTFMYTYSPGTDLPTRMTTSSVGFCKNDPELRYALGYSTLFGRESPDLVQMMILVMATKNPNDAIRRTVNAMEDSDDNAVPTTSDCCSCQQADKQFYKQQMETMRQQCGTTCGVDGQDDKKNSNSFYKASPFYRNAAKTFAPRHVAFSCIRAKLNALTASEVTPPRRPEESIYSSSYVGQFRAAVADYLYQNKMKAEYPNDFDPFLYPASAATLDAVLTPIVEAFNQDLQVLQQNLQEQLTSGVPTDKHLNYTSNGLISVKVVSGNQALAQTQSLNYFPQNPTLSLESLAKSLASAPSSDVPLLAGSLSSVIATTAAYAASLPKQVTAKVGSGLSLTVTPFTLSSDKGAELNVNVTYNENGAATLSSDATQSSATDDLNSRVSEHEVSTLVRMDSLKFFEISTMQSVIARQRKPWKPFDPIFELPLINTPGIVIARRKPEVIYNQSIIFLEASIMPTAADLGQGLIYKNDRVLIHSCHGAKDHPLIMAAHSAQDFCFDPDTEQNPLDAINQYHKQMITYFQAQYIAPGGEVVNPLPNYIALPAIPAVPLPLPSPSK
jgi:hypothetical protein